MSNSEGLRPFTVTAPGRLCLFGEHQDYLHLPVIALALPLCCRISVHPNTTGRLLTVRVPILDNQVWTYDLDQLPPRPGDTPLSTQENNPDFCLAAIYEALDSGWTFPHGAVCESNTDIPLQAGCSSSSAFCVAWCAVLAQLCGKTLTSLELAQRAHAAEVTHFGAPGGTMDHVTSACGGLVRIGPGMWDVTKLSTTNDTGCWVLADSGEPKDTFKHLQRCKQARLAIKEKLGGSWDAQDTSMLTQDEQVLLEATLVNRDMEEKAAQAWMDGSATAQLLGSYMDRHHVALRDGLHLSTPKLEAMRAAALDHGAYGFKVVGSGGGGCSVAWCSGHEQAQAVSQAMHAVGAKNTWIIDQPSGGAQLVMDD